MGRLDTDGAGIGGNVGKVSGDIGQQSGVH